jgi:hypothetical protein
MAKNVAEPMNEHGPRAWPGAGGFEGRVHTSGDRPNPAEVAGQRVLVVAAGRDAGPLAVALWEAGAFVALSVDRPVVCLPLRSPSRSRAFEHISTRIETMLQQRFAPDLRPWGLDRPTGDPTRALAAGSAWPLVGRGILTLVRQGAVPVFPGVVGASGATVEFADGRRDRFDRVILTHDDG